MNKSGKKTVALIGYAPMGNTIEQVQAQQAMQQGPVYAPSQPMYYPQPQVYQPTAYQQPAPAFNPNLVALGGIVILGLGAYMYFGDPFGSLFSMFKKDPAKDENEAYASFANRIYEAKGYFTDDPKAMYAIASEIASSGDKAMWSKVQDWFSRKYKKKLTEYINFLDGNQRNKFYAILSGRETYSAQANAAVQQDQSVFQQASNWVGITKAAELKEVACPYKRGEYIIVKPMDKTPRAVRTSASANGGGRASTLITIASYASAGVIFGNAVGNYLNKKFGTNPNIAFTMTSNKPECIGVATGKMYVNDDNGTKVQWVEIMHKVTNDDTSQKNALNYMKPATSGYMDFMGSAKKISEGVLLYVASSNLMPPDTVKNGQIPSQIGIVGDTRYIYYETTKLSGLGKAVKNPFLN